MLQGLAARHRGVERPRRLPQAEDPVRARRQQRQRPLGLVRQRDHQAGLQGRRLGHARHDRRRQQPHRDPRRAQGRGRDDEHGRHRPDVHRDQHPVGRARASATTASRPTCSSTTGTASSACKRVAIIRSSNRYGRFGVREIRDSARRLQRPIPIEMAYKVGQKDFTLELERIRNANPDAVVHWGDAVEGRADPQHDARDGHEAALLRLRPHGERRLREDRRQERRGRRRRVPVEPGAQGREARALQEGLPRALRRRGRDLRRARLRRHEHAALGDQRGGPQPRQDPRRHRVPPAPLARASPATSSSPRASTTWPTRTSPPTRTGAGTTPRAPTSAFRRATSRRATA